MNMDGVSEVRQQTNQLLFRLRDSRQMSDTWHEQNGNEQPDANGDRTFSDG